MTPPGERDKTVRHAMASIPSMTALLDAAKSFDGLADQARAVTTAELREAIAALRQRLQRGEPGDSDVQAVLGQARDLVAARASQRLVRVINATGVVLHTGLGRSVLPDVAIERLTAVAAGYCNLELDLTTGKRGRRGSHVEQLLCELTGAEAALVVNNNAAATMLALRALARDREVIVSRGQLIEIGGSFRLPEVMAGGGAVLREVGTTNKTHLGDYETAICDRTAMIMHVHTSNYRVVGFSACPTAAELSQLARARGLCMFNDLGSGALLEDGVWQSAEEPTVAAGLVDGADLVSFSGDKLLGGPQAGILLGSRTIIDRLRADPMARALRIDKLTIAALEAVLEVYHDAPAAQRDIPLLARLNESRDSLDARAQKLAERLRATAPNDRFDVVADESFAGGGSLPARPFPTVAVSWHHTGGRSVDELSRRLRLGEPSILARIRDDAIFFDLRTIGESECQEIVTAVAAMHGG